MFLHWNFIFFISFLWPACLDFMLYISIFLFLLHSASKCLIIIVFLCPDESNRVCLQQLRGHDGSDYVNASYVDVSFINFPLVGLYHVLLIV